MKESPKQHKAVFLHGGWRCASTYVWSRFRRNPLTTSFYEPFGESLARCSPKRIQRQTAQGWNSRHPPLALPYAQEYCALVHPFLKGVPGYRTDLALARYFPGEEGIAPEVRYVSRLIRHAQRRGTHPVLGFSRSLGRAAALKQAFGGYHVVLRRNPLQQWLSCRSYRTEVSLSYFELCHFLILALAPAGSPARSFAGTLDLPRLPRGLQRQFKFLHSAIYPWSDDQSYRAFTAVSILSHAAAESAADLVLDVDRLGCSPAYRDNVSDKILAETGLEVDFGDCRVPVRDSHGVCVDFAAVERTVRAQLNAFGAELSPSRAPAGAVVF
ncbi:MAG: hypothetical protein WAU49_16265 [Steroidobacteraceae bacterium]